MDYALIKSRAKEMGIALKDLARRIEVTEQGFHSMIRNNTMMMKHLESICEILNLKLVLENPEADPNIIQEPETTYGRGLIYGKYMSCLEEKEVLYRQVISLQDEIKRLKQSD